MREELRYNVAGVSQERWKSSSTEGLLFVDVHFVSLPS